MRALCGNSFWEFILGVVSGSAAWEFILGVHSVCVFSLSSCWAIVMGVLSGSQVWEFCLGVLYRISVWDVCREFFLCALRLGFMSGSVVWG